MAQRGRAAAGHVPELALPPVELLVLVALADGEQARQHPAGIGGDIADRTGGTSIAASSITAALQRLRVDGLVADLVAEDGAASRHHRYAITPAGQEYLNLQLMAMNRFLTVGRKRLRAGGWVSARERASNRAGDDGENGDVQEVSSPAS